MAVGVDGVVGALNDEAVSSADVFLELHGDFPVREHEGLALAHGEFEVVADAFPQLFAGSATEDFETVSACVAHGDSLGGLLAAGGCFIIQSTYHPVNAHLMELLIYIDCLKRASAKRITAVLSFSVSGVLGFILGGAVLAFPLFGVCKEA